MSISGEGNNKLIYIVEIDNGDMDRYFGGAFIEMDAAIAYANKQSDSHVYGYELDRPVGQQERLEMPDLRTGKAPR